VRDHVVPAVDTLPGNLGLSMFVTRDPAIVTVTTAWQTEQDRSESDHLLTPLRAQGSRILGGSAVSELLELAVLDRRRPAEIGFWTRMTRVQIDPVHVETAIDAYTASTLHDVQLLDGYCSAVLLVDRLTGAGVVSVTFDSRRTLETSREHGATLRTAGLAKAGAEVVEVREAEIVIAGIRMPQSG
jgi:hypothetical protein